MTNMARVGEGMTNMARVGAEVLRCRGAEVLVLAVLKC